MNKWISLACVLPACLLIAGIVESAASAQTMSADSNRASDVPVYVCPMHPQITSTDPEALCPLCGMDLVPLERATTDESGAIVVAPHMIQTMGVRTEAARVTDFDQSIRAFGHVGPDERRESVSASRIEGWIEHLAVRTVGEQVPRGALLYRVYSPALIGAQKDWFNDKAAGNKTRIAGSLQRLRSMGMQASVIDELSRTGRVMEQVPVYAEADGTVSFLGVREGDYVMPGTMILRLQSYDSVWVIASIPEQDLALIRIGQPASLRFPSAPGELITAAVDYVYPTIDAKTRTVDVRFLVENAANRILPGAYADIQLQVETARGLSVPSEAILRDSRGAHVIVALGEGEFAGRDVKTGISSNGRTEIRSGLSVGQNVVVSGQFMLDSEVSLREGLSKLAPASERDDEPPLMDHDHAGHQ